MQLTSEALERAIEQLSKLPGTGRKSAQRMALHLLNQDEDYVFKLSKALEDLKKKVIYCSTCFNIADQDPCAICSNPKRQKNVICVVENVRDVYVIEKSNEYRGVYHVLGGVISPMENVGPDDIRAKELLTRINSTEDTISEVILALNPDAEGETTCYYINKLLKPYDINVTRIAYGIPMGSELEFIDDATLSRAFESRTTF